MDYYFDNNPSISHQPTFYDIQSSTSSSPKPFADTLAYEATSFQPTDQSWAPLEFDDLTTFVDDQPQVPAPASITSSVETDKSSQETTRVRRRAQNRASQRAFRERKDRHLKGLEFQLENLNEKHQDLLQSYSKQSENVVKLQTRLAELRAEMKALKSLNTSSSNFTSSSSSSSKPRHNVGDSFDAFSFTVDSGFALEDRGKGDNSSNTFWRDESYSSGLGEHDGIDDMRLPGFEDLLRLA